MGWFILKHIFSTLLAIVNVRRLSDQEKIWKSWCCVNNYPSYNVNAITRSNPAR
jgi:hypothetical protein